MKTPRQIIDSLGCEAIAARLGISASRIKRARFEDQMPAQWYLALCDMTGEALPESLFSFKGLDKAAAE